MRFQFAKVLLFLPSLFLSQILIAQSDFKGSPYQLHAYKIESGFDSRSQEVGPNETVVENPYYLHLPLAESLPPNFTISLRIVSIAETPLSDPPVISLYLPATYKLFWDDTLIGFNGILPAEGHEENPGNSYRSFTLPIPEETRSTHTLRIEGMHTLSEKYKHALIITLQTISERLTTAHTTALTYALYLSFALFGIYLVAYFLTDRTQPHYLLLGLTCITFGFYAVNKLLYFQLNVPYPYLDWIGFVARAIFILLSILAPITLLYILGYRQRWIYLLSLLPILTTSVFSYLELIAVTAYLSVGISLASLFLKRTHSIPSLFVSIILLANYEVPYFEQRQAIGFGFLVSLLFVSIISIQIRDAKQKSLAQIRNTRLQLELLKSKIEPHFVLNSLTSAIEWIETNPRQGVKFIQALASEFELLSSISDKSEVSLATEVESCQTYLKIMGYRKKANYQLVLNNLDLNGSLPPSVIRNLLENAISHNDYGQSAVTFFLRQSSDTGKRKFHFLAPLEPAESKSKTPPEDGTGIRYIKARLAESYASWSFTHGPKAGFWETEILVP